MELMNCPSLAVPNDVMQHVVHVESSYNPYAIGVVGGKLVRQPRNLDEALATVRMLEGRGYNFSVGLAQVNRYNLARYGLDSYERAFETCPNLQAGSRILADCYGRSGGDWGKSFSCYYSGDFVTGYRHGYVQKIYASMRGNAKSGVEVAPIDVIGRPSRKSIDTVSRPAASAIGDRLVSQRVASTPATGSRVPASAPVPNSQPPAAGSSSQPAGAGTAPSPVKASDQAFVF